MIKFTENKILPGITTTRRSTRHISIQTLAEDFDLSCCFGIEVFGGGNPFKIYCLHCNKRLYPKEL